MAKAISASRFSTDSEADETVLMTVARAKSPMDAFILTGGSNYTLEEERQEQ